MEINKTSEDYLEAMLMMEEQYGNIRSVDVAEKLNVTKPSVSYMTKKLRENGYISMDTDGAIILLPAGRAIVEKIYNRHKKLAQFLINLGVNEELAYHDACLIEHDLSPEVYQALCDHIDQMSNPKQH